MKSWFLIKSGYYIVPSPSTTLILSNKDKFLSNFSLFFQDNLWRLQEFTNRLIANRHCGLEIEKKLEKFVIIKTLEIDQWKKTIRDLVFWAFLCPFLTIFGIFWEGIPRNFRSTCLVQNVRKFQQCLRKNIKKYQNFHWKICQMKCY